MQISPLLINASDELEHSEVSSNCPGSSVCQLNFSSFTCCQKKSVCPDLNSSLEFIHMQQRCFVLQNQLELVFS